MYSENFISKKLKTFAEQNEWLISGEYIYGEEQGVLFSGLDGKGEKIFITPVPGITQEQQDELFDNLEENKTTMKLTDYTITDDFLCIRVKDSMQLKSDDIEFILALLVGTLQDLNIITVGRCQECGKMDAETENFVYDLYCYMHEECAKNLEENSDDDDDDNSYVNSDSHNKEKSNFDSTDDSADTNDDSNDTTEDLADSNDDSTDSNENDAQQTYEVPMIKKVLFTIFGAILGSIPWIILPFIVDFVNSLITKVTENTLVTNFTQSLLTCVCAYLVSYFAIIGYRLSKAKMNVKGRWIVGIVSIAVVILIQFISLVVLIAKEPSVTLTFSNYISNISKSTFYINMLLGALIGIVFTLIAVLPFFDNSVSSSKAKKDFLSKRKLFSNDKMNNTSDKTSDEISDKTSDETTDKTSDETESSSDNSDSDDKRDKA